MEIVKKNILSLVCALVALIAVIALFWPVGGMYDDTRAELNKRVPAAKEVESIRKAQRFWPIIPDVTSGEKTPLGRFPTEPIIAVGNEIKERVKKQTGEIKELTATNNRHTTLLPNILPDPKDKRFQFAKEYMDTVQIKFPNILQAGVPPTDQEISDAALALWKTDFAGKVFRIDGKPINLDQVVADWNAKCQLLPDKLRAQTAAKSKVYLDIPGWITIQHEMPETTKPPTETGIWYAQSMLWVQGDIIAAIAQINAPAKNVSESPIKHIMRLDVGEDVAQYLTAALNADGAPAPPGKAFGTSVTGRTSNALYDVVSFTLVMNVDFRKIPTIMAGLEKGRLITIKQWEWSAVDGAAAADNGYLYGNAPIAKVTVKGEELLLRDWTLALMPDSIKVQLGILTQTSAGPVLNIAPTAYPANPNGGYNGGGAGPGPGPARD